MIKYTFMYVHVHRIIKVHQQSKLHQCTIAAVDITYVIINCMIVLTYYIIYLYHMQEWHI